MERAFFAGDIALNRTQIARRSDGGIAVDGFLADSVRLFEYLADEEAPPLKFADLKRGMQICIGLDNRVACQLAAPFKVIALSKSGGFARLVIPDYMR